MVENIAPCIPLLEDAAILAAAEWNTGGPTAVCTDLLREGYPIWWSAAEILSRWGQWVQGEIPYGPGAGSQANTNDPKPLLVSPTKAPTWLRHG